MIVFAQNENGERVYIENAQKTSAYFCPTCGQKVIAKKGKYRTHHFAHIASECTDRWNYDISEWHRNWQKQFPEECREVVITHNGEKHRADVLFEGIVFEFQNSKISEEEFAERNTFYVEAGHKVVWVFNFFTEYKNGVFRGVEKGDDVRFSRQGNLYLFDDFFAQGNKDILIWFDFTNNYNPSLISSLADGALSIEGVRFGDIKEIKKLFEESASYFEKRNKTKGNFSKKGGTKARGLKLINLCDKIELNYEDTDFKRKTISCPINGRVVVRNCMKTFREQNCEYVVFGEDCPFDFGCTARFSDIIKNWNAEEDKLLSIERDTCGVIESITVIKDGKEKEIDFSSAKPLL